MSTNPFGIFNPRPGFTCPSEDAPLRVVANVLREGLGAAEAVEEACGLPAARVHELAQGAAPVKGEDMLLRDLAEDAETQAKALDANWNANSIHFKHDFGQIQPHPGFRAPAANEPVVEVANTLRDGFGRAEMVEIAGGVPAARVHEIAQGVAASKDEEKALRWLAGEAEMVSRAQYQEFDDLAARFHSPEAGGPEVEPEL